MDISKIKALREETGLGMLEVKKALSEANDDLDKAREILSSQTIKKADTTRVASKGLTRVATKGNEAILFEVNAETDFVAKHKDFIQLLDDIADVLMNSKAITVKDANNVMMGDITVEQQIQKVSNIIKENAFLRRFHRIKKQDHQVFQTYMHQQGKVSVLVILNEANVLGKDLALQITSHAPKYLSYDLLDQETIDYERFMYEKEHGTLSDEDFIKHLRTQCLYDQPFIKDDQMCVKDVMKDLKVIDFYRFELGQGIENKLNCRLDVPCDGSKITVTPIY
jgi:elongation factor Ts